MADNSIQISLSSIRNTKKVLIDGIGSFTVRKMGAGESLDLSHSRRRLSKIIDELDKVDFTKYDLNKKEDVKAVEKLGKRVSDLTDEIDEIKSFELSSYKKCFEDQNGGKDVDELINTLTETERAELFNQIFGEVKVVDTPDAVEVETTEETS